MGVMEQVSWLRSDDDFAPALAQLCIHPRAVVLADLNVRKLLPFCILLCSRRYIDRFRVT
jgi:hypothetical protein